MNGNRYLLDTNAIIELLKGDSSLIKLLQDTHLYNSICGNAMDDLAKGELYSRFFVSVFLDGKGG
ncbi:hypothetical protein [Pleurocapsa sp. CCALA 161]|uniref:hypothetical protein n=1 Tax=Pleurocapsa sp. CCALA 161 TaxID=2107688 RepID=UPI0018EBC44B|nr:hypothetical protein [Pleurocapsa sp. CCALA 161]